MRFNRLVAVLVLVSLAACVFAAKQKKKDQQAATGPAAAPVPARTVTMKGVVFEDLNGNGRRDAGEPALKGMPATDGLTFVSTPAGGEFEFTLDEKVRGAVFVCTPAGWRASKHFFVLADFEHFDGKTQPADIGLVRDPGRNTDHFNFVQLTDTHVTEALDAIQTMQADVEIVNRLTDPVTFIVATGDLTNVGKNEDQFKAYLQGIQGARVPYYNVTGNHDAGGQVRITQNYEKYLAPAYYSFDVGPYHFIARDIIAKERDKEIYEKQMKWIDEDLRLNGQGKRVIMFQHFLPSNRELDWLADHNGVAIFSGHWHGRHEHMYRNVLDVNSATLRFGGIDRSPRGYRVIHVEGDRIRCEWRLNGQDKRIEIVQPAIEGTVGGPFVDLRVLAYDSADRVKQVRYAIYDGSKLAGASAVPLAEGALWAESAWSWTARCPVPAGTPEGPKFVRVEVTGVDGATWQKEGSFTLSGSVAPKVAAGEDWPFFHNDAGHRGYLPTGPRPPLSVAWAANIGGTINISSPVIAGGRVYAASSYQDSLNDCAVTALDLATGRKLWRAPVDSSITHSLAVHDKSVLAVSQAATLYCLDQEGFPRWTTSMSRDTDTRWETSFPVTDGKAVFAGRCNGFGAYDFTTGKRLWRQPGGTDWWPNIYSGPSLGTNAVYQGGPFVRALNPANGEILWANEKMAASTVAVVPAVVEANEQGDRLYVFHNKETLRCLDGKTGKEIWRATTPGEDDKGASPVVLGDETGTPAVGENIVCLGGLGTGSKEDKYPPAAMYGFDKADGQMLWRFAVGQALAPAVPYKREVATITSSPVIVGDVVYFGASDGWFYALDVASGKCVWKYWFGLPIASTVAVSGNTIIVTVWDGTVYALTAGS